MTILPKDSNKNFTTTDILKLKNELYDTMKQIIDGIDKMNIISVIKIIDIIYEYQSQY